MKAAELIANAIKLCGKRDYAVTTAVWHMTHLEGDGVNFTQYTLSMQPGLDGEKVGTMSADSIQALAEKLGEMVADRLMTSDGGTDDDDEDEAPHQWAINVYSADWQLVETYTVTDSRRKAEDIAARDNAQLSKRGQQGLHVRIDELDGEGNYVPGTIGHVHGVNGTKVPTITA